MPKLTFTRDELDALVRERMAPIIGRMEVLAEENQRLREGSALESYVDARVTGAEQEAREKVSAAELKARRYQERAYRAERKLKLVLEGELDPFDLMTPEQLQKRGQIDDAEVAT